MLTFASKAQRVALRRRRLFADACESESIDFGSGGGNCPCRLVESPSGTKQSKVILSDASAITVELHNEGVNMSATQRSTGVKYGSFAAALVDLKNNKERELKFPVETQIGSLD